jgi:hypothetical protein
VNTPKRRPHPLPVLLLLVVLPLAAAAAAPPRVEVTLPASTAGGPVVAGRLLVLVATDGSREPRHQVGSSYRTTAQVFGVDVADWQPGTLRALDAGVFGYPLRTLAELPAGTYHVQAVLHRYERVTPAHGHTIEVPWDRGEGQQWSAAPGNLYSQPVELVVASAAEVPPEPWRLTLDQVNPPLPPPQDSKYVRHVRLRSELLSKFWGRDVFLGAHVLLPHGFDEHPEARYPLMIFHGHFPDDFSGFREAPPNPEAPCVPAPRFGLDCYNRVVEQEAYDFYQRWTGPDFPRFLAVEIQHPTPFYDDSYAVNSANNGPYGDAITYELVPHLEKTFRGLGAGWARFLYGGSTGGWIALATQVFYPKEYNGAFAACPDPVDFRAFALVDLYADANAYSRSGPFQQIAIPVHRDWRGQVSATMAMENHLELALGTRSRSGGQFDGWEAVYSPVGPDGYPRRIFDKATGVIDPETAAYWREHYDLRHILARDWRTIGPDLVGKIHVYVGDMDNYYLNNAVYLLEEFLAATSDPPYAGKIAYGDRFEHCWNGDPDAPNYLTRLRYHTMYLPRILERLETSAPPGADLSSWRY